MRCRKVNPRYARQDGTALIEAALVIGILIQIVFAGFALAYSVRSRLHAMAVAALANQALYRDCRFEHPLRRPACMTALVALLERSNTVSGLDARIIMSLYTSPFLSGNPPYSSPLLVSKTADTPYGGTRFSTGSFNTSSPHLSEHFELNGMVWIAEVYVSSPVSYMGIGGTPIYEASIS